MQDSLTLSANPVRRFLSFAAGAGMLVMSAITIDHFYAANYPESIYEGSVCDISAFFNCDSSAFSAISNFGGVPMGYFGLIVGLLVMLGAVFPSEKFERTNKTLALLNVIGVVVLLVYSVVWLGSLCLLCSAYYVASLISLWLFWRYGVDGSKNSLMGRFGRPSLKHIAVAAVVTGTGDATWTNVSEGLRRRIRGKDGCDQPEIQAAHVTFELGEPEVDKTVELSYAVAKGMNETIPVSYELTKLFGPRIGWSRDHRSFLSQKTCDAERIDGVGLRALQILLGKATCAEGVEYHNRKTFR